MKHRRPAIIFFSSIGLMGALYACSGTQVTDMVDLGPPTVEIDKEVHFLTLEGEDVVVAPGAYGVRAEKEGLRLIAEEGASSESQLIEAKPITHEETAKASTALSYSEQEDEHIVMLLLPNGKGLEAQGSYSGVTKRALRSKNLRRRQITRQFDIRRKLKLKPTQLTLSSISVRYPTLKKTHRGYKTGTTWRLPVSDTLHTGTFTFVWNGYQLGGGSLMRTKPSLKLLINGKAAKSPQMQSAKGGNLMTSVSLSFARANTWPKTIKLEITNGAKRWESAGTKVYAKTVSYYTSELHPIFSHKRCTTCHALGDHDAIVTMHQQREVNGYPTGDEIQPQSPDACAGCHTIPADSSHTDVNLNNEWFSPAAVQGINWAGWSAGRVCAKVTGPFTNQDGVTGAPFDAQTFNHHFHVDPRILWAVSSGWIPFGRPDLPVPMKNNLQGWFDKVDPWVEAGTPCPTWRFFKRPGQFPQRQLAPRR